MFGGSTPLFSDNFQIKSSPDLVSSPKIGIFLGVCLRFTGPDSEGIEMTLIAKVPSFASQRSERTMDTLKYIRN